LQNGREGLPYTLLDGNICFAALVSDLHFYVKDREGNYPMAKLQGKEMGCIWHDKEELEA
jgi:hypothetical protein